MESFWSLLDSWRESVDVLILDQPSSLTNRLESFSFKLMQVEHCIFPVLFCCNYGIRSDIIALVFWCSWGYFYHCQLGPVSFTAFTLAMGSLQFKDVDWIGWALFRKGNLKYLDMFIWDIFLERCWKFWSWSRHCHTQMLCIIRMKMHSWPR